MEIIEGLIGLFTGQQAKLMWGLVVTLVVVAAIGTGVFLFLNMKKDNQLLKAQNGQLTQQVQQRDDQIKQIAADQQDFLDRANRVVSEMGTLQKKMVNNDLRRQTDIDNIVTKPGTGATTEQIAAKANAGMNALFHDLSTLSREGTDEKK